MKYLKRSKSTEARQNIHRIYEAGRRIAIAEHGGPAGGNLFPPSVGPTPPLGECCRQGGTCAANAAQWQQPTWHELGFSVGRPHHYSYQFVSDATSFTARAIGDLDCDGEYATYEMYGAIVTDGKPPQLPAGRTTEGAGLYWVNPLE